MSDLSPTRQNRKPLHLLPNDQYLKQFLPVEYDNVYDQTPSKPAVRLVANPTLRKQEMYTFATQEQLQQLTQQKNHRRNKTLKMMNSIRVSPQKPRPDMYPRAGIKHWADWDQVHGPLNGAMNELNEIEVYGSYQKRSSLERNDISSQRDSIIRHKRQSVPPNLQSLENTNISQTELANPVTESSPQLKPSPLPLQPSKIQPSKSISPRASQDSQVDKIQYKAGVNQILVSKQRTRQQGLQRIGLQDVGLGIMKTFDVRGGGTVGPSIESGHSVLGSKRNSIAEASQSSVLDKMMPRHHPRQSMEEILGPAEFVTAGKAANPALEAMVRESDSQSRMTEIEPKQKFQINLNNKQFQNYSPSLPTRAPVRHIRGSSNLLKSTIPVQPYPPPLHNGMPILPITRRHNPSPITYTRHQYH